VKRLSLSVVLGITLAGVGTIALASRNTAGVYALPAGNPVSSGTAVSSTWANSTLGDLAAGLTDSLSRSGYGGMQAPIRTPDGTVAAPAFSFTNDSGSGLYRIGANDYGFAVNGVKQQEWTGSATTIVQPLTASGGITLGAQITGMTRASLPAVGQQISGSSGNWTTSSVTPGNVTNLSVTLTTTGRPVLVSLQSDGSSNNASVNAGTSWVSALVLRDGSVVARNAASGSGGIVAVPCGSVFFLDAPGAGSHTYTVQAACGGGTCYVNYCSLVAFEL
jgi:hypothetical protein